MKTTLFLLLFVTILLPVSAKDLTFSLFTWESLEKDDGSYDIPKPLGEKLTFKAELIAPTGPGQITIWKQKIETMEVSGQLKVHWIYPYADSGFPQYYNVEVSLDYPVETFCTMSPRIEKKELPPLVCAGGDNKRRVGVTLLNR